MLIQGMFKSKPIITLSLPKSGETRLPETPVLGWTDSDLNHFNQDPENEAGRPFRVCLFVGIGFQGD